MMTWSCNKVCKQRACIVRELILQKIGTSLQMHVVSLTLSALQTNTDTVQTM